MISSRFQYLEPGDYGLPADLVDRAISPALVVHLDRLRENLRRVVAHTGGRADRWRPHIKTTKIPEVFVELMRAGVRQFSAGTVDFAASDVPLKADEIAQVSRGVLQIPMTAGAIAVAYNHPDCELKLSQAQLVDIFLGKIRNFSDVGCPAKPIKVVHRSDASGTTANFTAHLAAISPAWKAGPGVGKTVNWPLGIGAKGNEGVSAQLSQVDGGIGYVEVAYVKGDLQSAALTNGSGETVKPTTESETTALASIDLGPDLIGSNPNPDTAAM